MLSSEFVNLSSDSVYITSDFSRFNPLSRFLLNLYLTEFDDFINFSSYNNSSVQLFNNTTTLIDFKTYFSFLFKTVPIKLERNLSTIQKLYLLNNLRVSIYKDYFLNDFKKRKFKIFSKRIFYVRFLDFFLIGFVGSNDFSLKIFNDSVSFLKSNLHVDCIRSKIVPSLNSYVLFLGFYINISSSYNLSLFKFKSKYKKKYFLKIVNRLSAERKSLSKIISERFNSELFLIIKKALDDKHLKFSKLNDIKLWLYVFQLECVRATQVFKLLKSKDNDSLISNDSFDFLKFNKFQNLFTYRRFSFNLYIKKLQFSLNYSVSSFSPDLYKSVIGVDLVLSDKFQELSNILKFCYENFYLDTRFSNYANLKDFELSKVNVTGVENFFSPLHIPSKSFDILRKRHIFILAPTDLVIKQLASLNYFNIRTKKPISNLKYVFADDVKIISNFASTAKSLLIWYSCCDNFSKLKRIVDIVRQSCVLTLCRKHNKSKDWVYSVYTPNLICYQNLSYLNSSFPTYDDLFFFKKQFLINESYKSYFDERTFLNY